MCSKAGSIGFLGLTAEVRGGKTVNKERCGGVRWSGFTADGTGDQKVSQRK